MRLGIGIEPADPPTGIGRGDFTARLYDLVAVSD
jgi:hypothetical protein